MSGSVAEERIRAKVEAAMRRRWPEARIIHELVIDTWKIRIDLAAVSPDHIAVAEIKSERDVLKRLPSQVAAGIAVAQDVWVVVAEKHEERLNYLRSHNRPLAEPEQMPGGWLRTVEANPDRLPDLDRCRVLVERGETLEPLGYNYDPRSYIVDPRALFDMLWASERRAVLRQLGAPVGPRTTCLVAQRWAVENLSGAQIRRAVCAQLRSRPFPRADSPISPTPADTEAA